jgi:predicted nucleic acid-binding protein
VKVLFDTNVILDLLLDRAPFSAVAAQLCARVERGDLEGCLCATTVTTVRYLAAKVVGASSARQHLRQLLALLEVAPVNRLVLEAALSAPFADFEDAVVHEAARHAGAQGLVTRNVGDFKRATLPVYSPMELMNVLDASR